MGVEYSKDVIMKKIILIILIMLYFSYNLNAGPFVKFETGPSINVPNIYFVEGIIGFKFRFLKHFESQTYGGWLTWSLYGDNGNSKCSPVMEIYSINQKFIYRNIFIRFQHYCAHPVISLETNRYDSQGNYMYTEPTATPYYWFGTMETVSIGFEYEWK